MITKHPLYVMIRTSMRVQQHFQMVRYKAVYLSYLSYKRRFMRKAEGLLEPIKQVFQSIFTAFKQIFKQVKSVWDHIKEVLRRPVNQRPVRTTSGHIPAALKRRGQPLQPRSQISQNIVQHSQGRRYYRKQ